MEEEPESRGGWSSRPTSECKIWIKYLYYYFGLATHLAFSDMIRFAVHVPPSTAPSSPPTTDGMLIIMYHPLQGQTGLTFCRPGDAAWTKLDNLVIHDDEEHQGRSSSFSFVDFAYFNDKIFAMDRTGVTAVFHAATLDFIDLIDVPPDTENFWPKLFNDSHGDDEQVDRLHLVALPSKLVLVRACVNALVPESFAVFQLKMDDDDGQEMRWCKMIEGIGGDLFLDDHHATFFGTSCGPGNRIYYVPNCHHKVRSIPAYCYSVLDGNLECVYRPPEYSDEVEYSTRPSWFVP